jgi:hypothetical protein
VTIDAQNILDWLEGNGVYARADGDMIRFSGAKGVVTPELRETMRPHKAAMLALLRIDPDGVYHSPDGGLWEETPGGWRRINPPEVQRGDG